MRSIRSLAILFLGAIPTALQAHDANRPPINNRELGLIELQRSSGGNVDAVNRLEAHLTVPGKSHDAHSYDLLGWRLLAANRPVDNLLAIRAYANAQP